MFRSFNLILIYHYFTFIRNEAFKIMFSLVFFELLWFTFLCSICQSNRDTILLSFESKNLNSNKKPNLGCFKSQTKKTYQWFELFFFQQVKLHNKINKMLIASVYMSLLLRKK